VSPNLVEPGGSYTVTFAATPGAEQNDYLSDFATEGALAWVSGEQVGVLVAGSCPTGTITVAPGSSVTCTYDVPANARPSVIWDKVEVIFSVETFDTVPCLTGTDPTGTYCVIGPAESDGFIAVDGARLLSGTVVNANGTPAAGVFVGVDGSLGGDTYEATTAADGTYSVPVEAEQLDVYLPDYGSTQYTSTLCSPGTIDAPDCFADTTTSNATANFQLAGVTVTGVAVTGATTTAPASGPTAGSTPITITGTGFGSPGAADTVSLAPTGGSTPIAASNVVVVNNTTVTAVTAGAAAAIPAGESSVVTDVEVTAGGLTSPINAPADRFTYTNGPTVTSVSASMSVPGTLAVRAIGPMGPVVGGEPLKILGSGFTLATEVDFDTPGGQVAATAVPQVASDTEIDLAQTPDLTAAVNAAGGVADEIFDVVVKDTTALGVEASTVAAADQYTAKVPVVTAVTPSVGPLTGDISVTVTGQWFTGADLVAFSAIGGDTLTPSVEAPAGPLADDPANPTVPEDNQLTFTAPDATALFSSGYTGKRTADTVVDIPVTGSASAIVSPPNTKDVHTFGPTVTALSEHTDNVKAGDVVTVTGSGFTGATEVLLIHHESSFAGVLNTDPPIAVSPTSDSSLTFTAPDETANMFATDNGGTFQNVVVDVEVVVPETGGPTETSAATPKTDLLTFAVPSVTSVTPPPARSAAEPLSASEGPVSPGSPRSSSKSMAERRSGPCRPPC